MTRQTIALLEIRLQQNLAQKCQNKRLTMSKISQNHSVGTNSIAANLRCKQTSQMIQQSSKVRTDLNENPFIIKPFYNIMQKLNNSQQSINRCTICLQGVGRASINGCSHEFCLRCIRKWAKSKNTCPLCRESFRQIRQGRRMYKVQQIIPPQKNRPTQGRIQGIRGGFDYFPVFLNPIPLYFYYVTDNQNFTYPGIVLPLQNEISHYENVSVVLEP